MRQYEYRIENIPLSPLTLPEQQLLAVLNEFGEEGWRVCSIDALPKRQSQPNSLRVLLERRIDKRRGQGKRSP